MPWKIQLPSAADSLSRGRPRRRALPVLPKGPPRAALLRPLAPTAGDRCCPEGRRPSPWRRVSRPCNHGTLLFRFVYVRKMEIVVELVVEEFKPVCLDRFCSALGKRPT